MRTYSPKPADIKREWLIIDATDVVLGRLAVQAIAARDYPLLQGCILVIAFSYVLVNLVTDFIYVLADPRVRLQ